MKKKIVSLSSREAKPCEKYILDAPNRQNRDLLLKKGLFVYSKLPSFAEVQYNPETGDMWSGGIRVKYIDFKKIILRESDRCSTEYLLNEEMDILTFWENPKLVPLILALYCWFFPLFTGVIASSFFDDQETATKTMEIAFGFSFITTLGTVSWLWHTSYWDFSKKYHDNGEVITVFNEIKTTLSKTETANLMSDSSLLPKNGEIT